jgi:chromate transporter
MKPTFNEAFRFWLYLGFVSFGGPAGQIGIMHDYLVSKKKWISNSKFLHALNYCMILPGPEAQQLATYIGWLMHGTRGGLVAGLLFILPSMIILAFLSIIYVSFGSSPWVSSFFDGLKPAIIAIVILALVKISKKSLQTPLHYAIAVFAFTCIFFFSVPFPIIILSTAIIAYTAIKIFPEIATLNQAKQNKISAGEHQYYINSETKYSIGNNTVIGFAKKIFTGIAFWITPLLLLYYFTSDFIFWQLIATFFTKAALVTFGGAYAVLPYVAQMSVEKYNWLTNIQMIDGLALGETTPGPLVIILSFVGFMAGYNHFDHSVMLAVTALVVTTYYTFLPSFLFIFIGGPIIERSHENEILKTLLGFITAAVVGVILNLTIYLGKAVLFENDISIEAINSFELVWVILSFIALYRFNVNIILWITISAAVGIIRLALSI